jgi:hypothetical protein
MTLRRNRAVEPNATPAHPAEPLHTREVAGSKPAAPIVLEPRYGAVSSFPGCLSALVPPGLLKRRLSGGSPPVAWSTSVGRPALPLDWPISGGGQRGQEESATPSSTTSPATPWPRCTRTWKKPPRSSPSAVRSAAEDDNSSGERCAHAPSPFRPGSSRGGGWRPRRACRRRPGSRPEAGRRGRQAGPRALRDRSPQAGRLRRHRHAPRPRACRPRYAP